ncbi:[FeFe] hydrogenase H-cluster radical SAM maturase HydE [Mycoplasma sp. P36-A1]|uniref:[FeFe] hydrogenase H-cluster radical SAM maturase HydE n=1 Tax=Mycoplasma sp. P36-A1 TaxID=3252900 RepID=UPI003C2DB572
MIFEKFDISISEIEQNKIKKLVDLAFLNAKLSKDQIEELLNTINYQTLPYLQQKAVEKRKEIYGDKLYIRGLIEISNYCKKDCLYCGIRKSNKNVNRYRYDEQTIKKIIDHGYSRGYHTIVMQGGEDDYYTDEKLSRIIHDTKEKYPDIAITLSVGERSKSSYLNLYDSGADRFLLRHETANQDHYALLHPKEMSLETRMQALKNLKEIGYQTGAGFMVGSPFQSMEDIVNDIIFLQDFQPQMVGIGPYLNHHETPFYDMPNGKLEHVLIIYSLVRLLVPNGLIPSTTATSSVNPLGRLQALKSGCNVIMINLSDMDKRQDYTLYENKSYKGDESDEFLQIIEQDIIKAGMEIDFSIGNYKANKGE